MTAAAVVLAAAGDADGQPRHSTQVAHGTVPRRWQPLNGMSGVEPTHKMLTEWRTR